MHRGPSLIGGPFRLPSKDGSGGGSSRDPHRPNCLCCIGPPDHAFELAVTAVRALAVEGVGAAEAEKFVRLCCTAGGGDARPLSKGKAKAACKTLRPKASGLPPIDPQTLERMQRAVLDVYRVPTPGASTATAAMTDTTTTAETPAADATAAQPPTPID